MTVAALSHRLLASDPQQKGVSPPAIWDWFYKGAVPKSSTLELLSKVTGIPLDELYRLTDHVAPETRALAQLKRRVQKDRRLSEVTRARVLACLTSLGAPRGPRPPPQAPGRE